MFKDHFYILWGNFLFMFFSPFVSSGFLFFLPPSIVKNFLKKQFILFLAVRCCTWAFSSCGEQGLLFVVVHGLLIAVASLVAEHGI